MLFSLFGPSKPAVPAAAPASAPAAAPAAPSPPPQAAQPLQQATPPPQAAPPSATSPRALRQLGLFVAGAAFFALSVTVTRRSVVRKQRAAALKFYEPTPTAGGRALFEGEAAASPSSSSSSPSSLVALEALNLATLNVVSFFVMLTGGAAWALDLSSLADVRQRARQYTRGPGLGGSGGAQTDAEAEREVEEWMARVLKTLPAAVGGKGKGAEGKGAEGAEGPEGGEGGEGKGGDGQGTK